MNQALFQIPFVQIALPIMFTMLLSVRVSNKSLDSMNRRVDDMRSDFNKRFDEIIKRLDRIETKLDDRAPTREFQACRLLPS